MINTSVVDHKRTIKNHPARNLRVIAGLSGPLLLGLGSGISVSAGFGAFGFSVLLDGINQTLHLPLWLSQVLITLACYVIAWKWAGIPLGFGTLPALFLIGPAISFGASMTPDTFHFLGNVLAFVWGLSLFSLGISLSAAAALGPDGITALSLAAEKQLGWPISSATFLWNLTAIACGTALGGNCGIASIAGLFFAPVLIHMLVFRLRAMMYVPLQKG
ncbi:MAG: hypothetical protein AB8B63_21105 [Granulosicoccus sp.]